MPNKILELTNQRFGRLTVLKRLPSKNGGSWQWLCQCECGNFHTVAGKRLTGGGKNRGIRSCGCNKGNHRHGYARTPIYNIWSHMRERCNNPTNKDYKNYGGRGITVCKRWEKFENFLADVGNRPPGLSLDRINNNGNYEPDNVKWSTSKEQNGNTRMRRIDQFSTAELEAELLRRRNH